MKKLLIIAAVAACAIQAQAATYYGLGMTLNKGADNKIFDGKTSRDVAQYYSAYSMSSSTLSEICGSSVKTADDLITWLWKNPKANRSAFEDEGNEWYVADTLGKDLVNNADNYLNGRLASTDSATAPTVADNVWFAVFYDNGDDHYVRFAQLNPDYSGSDATAAVNDMNLAAGQFVVEGATGMSWTGWTAVPEPTSGLLLLLGMAGLALKRRRA